MLVESFLHIHSMDGSNVENQSRIYWMRVPKKLIYYFRIIGSDCKRRNEIVRCIVTLSKATKESGNSKKLLIWNMEIASIMKFYLLEKSVSLGNFYKAINGENA